MWNTVSLVTLGVDDLSRARGFYEALGWSGAQQPDAEVCFSRLGGWSSDSGQLSAVMVHQGSLAHNVRSPEEVESGLAEAERAGGTVVPRPRLIEAAAIRPKHR